MSNELTHRGTRLVKDSDQDDTMSRKQKEFPESKTSNQNSNNDDRLNFMEELVLLSFQNEGDVASVWKDSISLGLRCAIMAELGLRGKITLKTSNSFTNVNSLYVSIVPSASPCGDIILDEALEIIKKSKPRNVITWIELFSGVTWNPLNLVYQIRNLRDRICKSLSEKGICSVQFRDSVLTNFVLYPFKNLQSKQKLVSKLHDFIFNHWSTDVSKMNLHYVIIFVIADISDVLQTFYSNLSVSEYSIASTRVEQLCSVDFGRLARENPKESVVWNVLACNKLILM